MIDAARFGVLRLCAVDGDCVNATYPGDTCVPATSRAVVAKRVLKNIMLRNVDVMNFGLMTFSQGQPTTDLVNYPTGRSEYYFPYFPNTTTSVAETFNESQYFTKRQLEDNKPVECYDDDSGPEPTCVVNGVTWNRRPLNNSRYSIHRGKGNFADTDYSWCGDEKCNITTGYVTWSGQTDTVQGTGIYQGSYYQRVVTTYTYDSVTGTAKQFPTYQGRSFVSGGVTYNYFKPRDDYYWNPQSGSNRPAIKGPVNCDYLSDCSGTCGALWDPALMPGIDTTNTQAITDANVAKMLGRLEKAEDGGLMMWERTPTGCALFNGTGSNGDGPSQVAPAVFADPMV